MPRTIDGPSSPLFSPLSLRVKGRAPRLRKEIVSAELRTAASDLPRGSCVRWGIPFNAGKALVLRDRPAAVSFDPARAKWLVFMHTSDVRPQTAGASGFPEAKNGVGRLGEHAADYVILYADGTEARVPVRRRHEVGTFEPGWDRCFQAVQHSKPHPRRPHHEQGAGSWGRSQTRVGASSGTTWLWAWQNPRPRKAIVGLRLEPINGTVLLFAISAGRASSHPLRWEPRCKAVVRLPRGVSLDPTLDEAGLLSQIRLDMGQVISAVNRRVYPDAAWGRTRHNLLPGISEQEVLVEYTAHPDACFHLIGDRTVSVRKIEKAGSAGPVTRVAQAGRSVTIRAVEKKSRKQLAVKLHVHGEAGEYLSPVDRHRIPNPSWFEDYSVDHVHQDRHYCTYVMGKTRMDLPLGKVYVEASKGFEIAPVRKAFRVTPTTKEIVIELEKALSWRERGWVSADTHVHFLSPTSGLLEGAGEGVNVVNLLASQWGELVTNVGDFDGKTTFGSREVGGEGEYLLRVGTENRQSVLGHISLLGYEGDIIAPMTTGGPNESALGDPVGALMTEWAMQCKRQNGVVVIPHFPNPRSETAATLVVGGADAVEWTSLRDQYGGLNPYSVADWYRYLNCGYLTAAVGGTDKMSAATAVGEMRTYAQIDADREFTYETWKEAVRKARTFATCGPLLEFSVEGQPPGSRLSLGSRGGTVDVTWKVASVTVPLSRVELVVNGEIRESRAVRPRGEEGHWSVGLDRSSWLALLVRGHYADKPEIIAAHSSPVMVELERSPILAAADAVTILDQIEGALAYLDSVGTRAEDSAYKRMRLALTAAHRSLHNRLHRVGRFHQHTVAGDDAAHDR
jgi:hypothetical protein